MAIKTTQVTDFNTENGNNSLENFDVIIVGGGMVGAALALGLAKQKKKIAMVEGVEPLVFEPTQAMDLRVSAISPSSVALFKDLQAWDDVLAMRTHPYTSLETWEWQSSRIRFNAQDLGLDQLGFMVENRVLQLALWQQIKQFENVTLLCPDRLDRIEFDESVNHVRLSSGNVISAPWVIGADGANSKVRKQAKIGISAWDYRQQCMLINVELLESLNQTSDHLTTWQWFTPSGPRSFLPLPPSIEGKQQASLVWYDNHQRIKQLQALPYDKLALEIKQHFPNELGDINVQQAGSFPLTRRHAQRYLQNRCILVGDAAHTINPLAGQGVNLGFKDVAILLECIADKGITTDEAFIEYQKRRRPDNLIMQAGMDFFYTTFSNEITPLKLTRNAALKLADRSGAIKNQVLKYALGM